MIKTARTPAESQALEREIDVLRRVAHPGVVEIGSVTTDAHGLLTVRTRYVGPSLEEWRALAPAEVAGLGAALATVVADLHDLGIAHGHLQPRHVLVDPNGRPVLCGFGPARTGADAADADIAALRQLLAAAVDGPMPSRLAQLLRPSSRRARALSARALADGLARCLPDVRLPAVEGPEKTAATAEPVPPRPSMLVKRHPLRVVDPADESGRGPVALAVAAIVGVFVVGTALTLVFTHHHPQAKVAATTPCPPADDGCTPLAIHEGTFATAAGRFAIDLKPVIVVIGRWHCGNDALPAALDPATGQIWAWRTWPGQEILAARPLAHVPGATGLDVEPEPSGCDRLVVRRARAAPVVLRPTGSVGLPTA
jgi:hypothetical protein